MGRLFSSGIPIAMSTAAASRCLPYTSLTAETKYTTNSNSGGGGGRGWGRGVTGEWQREQVGLLVHILEGQEAEGENTGAQLPFSFPFSSVWSYASGHGTPGHQGSLLNQRLLPTSSYKYQFSGLPC